MPGRPRRRAREAERQLAAEGASSDQIREETGRVGGQPLGSARRAEAETYLRERTNGLGSDPLDVEAARRVRVELLAYELIRSGGDVREALEVLGHDLTGLSDSRVAALADAELKSKHGELALSRHIARLDQRKDALITRMVSIALGGADENAIRAFGQLAKIAGWNAPQKHEIKGESINLHAVLKGGPRSAHDDAAAARFLARTAHEPGEAIAVTSGNDKVDALVRRRAGDES